MSALDVLVTDHPFTGFEPEMEVLAPLDVRFLLAEQLDGDLETLALKARAILVCYETIDAAIIDAAASAGCSIIARYGIGYDNVDIDAATEAGILVTNVPDYCLDEVADHTLALLLAAARQVCVTHRGVRAGGWTSPGAAVNRIAGRRLALVGFGAIGRRVAARARAFGLSIAVFDPYADRSISDEVEWLDSVEDAIRDADFISLHAPLNAGTARLINHSSLAVATRSPILINAARGGLVDHDAVVDALAEGILGGAALDVTEPEPLPIGHPLRRHPRAIVTAHSAFYSVEAQEELQRKAAEEVARALRGEAPINVINDQLLERT